VSYLNDKVIAEQQKIADTFLSLKLIPKPLSIREAVWLPQEPRNPGSQQRSNAHF
jgi:sulfonate transport system substrate-binding protein